MLLVTLQDLQPSPRRTVVINVNTDLVATLALISAIEVVGDPVLLVNCEPTEASRRTFNRLATTYEFDQIEAPVRLHGVALDWLFSSLRDELVLLLDSDAEVRDADFVSRMRAAFEHPLVFGAGFTEGPVDLSGQAGAPPGFLFMERPWLPCVMFRASMIRQALDAGRSFLCRSQPNDFWFSARLSRFLGARFGPPWTPPSRRFQQLPCWARRRLASLPFDQLRFARRDYHGMRPSVAFFDTGGDIYHYLRFQKELLFAGLPMELIDGEVAHFSGVTRHAMHGPVLPSTDGRSVAAEVIARLHDRYGYAWEGPDE